MGSDILLLLARLRLRTRHKIEQFRRYLVLPGKMSASMQLRELFCHVVMRGVHSGETSRVLGRDGFDHSFGQARRDIFRGEFFEKHAGGEVVKWKLFPLVGGKSRQIERQEELALDRGHTAAVTAEHRLDTRNSALRNPAVEFVREDVDSLRSAARPCRDWRRPSDLQAMFDRECRATATQDEELIFRLDGGLRGVGKARVEAAHKAELGHA
jgi:hypothetical protein